MHFNFETKHSIELFVLAVPFPIEDGGSVVVPNK
jgi:hypothetical protein